MLYDVHFIATRNMQVPPPILDEEALNQMFKEVDFEKIAKDMEQLFKEIDEQEKTKKTKNAKNDVEQPAGIASLRKTSAPITAKPIVSSLTSHASASFEELFIKPQTETPPAGTDKDILWLTQATLDAANTTLDRFVEAINTLANKVIESRIVIFDTFLELGQIDTIKVACNIIKSKTTYKRLLLIPQVINPNLEKPVERMRKDIIETTKKATLLAEKIIIISAEKQQKNDIAQLNALAKASQKIVQRPAGSFAERLSETIVEDNQIEAAIENESPIQTLKADDIFTFFNQSLAPLAQQLGTFTRSPEAQNAIEEKTKEREQRIKAMADRVKNQRSSSRNSFFGNYDEPYRHNSSRYPFHRYPESRDTSSDARSSYNSPHHYNDSDDEDEERTTPQPATNTLWTTPLSYGGYSPQISDISKGKKTEDKTLKLNDSATITDSRTKVINLRETFVTMIKEITETFDGTGDDWNAYHQEVSDQLAQPAQELLKPYHDYKLALKKLPKDIQKDCFIDTKNLIDFLEHLIYMAVYDILASKNDLTLECVAYAKLLEQLSIHPSLKQKQNRQAYAIACSWITAAENPLRIAADQPLSSEHPSYSKLKSIIDRLGATHVPLLTEALKNEPKTQKSF